MFNISYVSYITYISYISFDGKVLQLNTRVLLCWVQVLDGCLERSACSRCSGCRFWRGVLSGLLEDAGFGGMSPAVCVFSMFWIAFLEGCSGRFACFQCSGCLFWRDVSGGLLVFDVLDVGSGGMSRAVGLFLKCWVTV